MPDVDSTATSGIEARGYRRGTLTTDGWDQYVVPVKDRIESYRGRAGTFRIPGLAGTTGQKLLSIHNATGSTTIVDIEHITMDVYQTAAKLVAPPILRAHRVTVLPSGGAALGKVAEDSSLTSSASVTLLQGASADGTGVALVATIPAASILTQEHVPRALTLAGYEPADRVEFLAAGPITLRALEGIVLNLDYTVATSNPITDMYVLGIKWSEWTRP